MFFFRNNNHGLIDREQDGRFPTILMAMRAAVQQRCKHSECKNQPGLQGFTSTAHNSFVVDEAYTSEGCEQNYWPILIKVVKSTPNNPRVSSNRYIDFHGH